MNEQVVLVAIGLAVLAVIVWPLIRGRSGRGGEVSSLTPEMAEQLAELELDRSMGRVSEADYARFRGELESKTPPAPVVETPGPAADSRARAEELVRHWHQAPRPSCAKCGVRPEPEATFCSNCGSRLRA